MLRLVLSLALLVFTVAPAQAQRSGGQPVEVAVGSELRKELFDQLRPRIARIAKKPVKFEGSLKSLGNWAFFSGRAVNENGDDLRMGAGESADTAALWRKTDGAWELVEFSGGHSDVVYVDWPQKFGAPPALVGGQESESESSQPAKSAKSLRTFLLSTKGTYGWAPVKGSTTFDFFPDGRLHIQGPDGEATMWEGKWRLEGDQLTIINSTLKKTQVVTASIDGADLLLDGKRYRRSRP